MVMMQMTIMVTLMNKINRGLLYGFHFERFEEMEREFFCKFFFVFFFLILAQKDFYFRKKFL